MMALLKRIKESGKPAVFLLPSLPSSLEGSIASLSSTKIVIEADHDGTTYQYATHPHHVVVVSRKSS